MLSVTMTNVIQQTLACPIRLTGTDMDTVWTRKRWFNLFFYVLLMWKMCHIFSPKPTLKKTKNKINFFPCSVWLSHLHVNLVLHVRSSIDKHGLVEGWKWTLLCLLVYWWIMALCISQTSYHIFLDIYFILLMRNPLLSL